MDHRKL
jgi:MFS family permease